MKATLMNESKTPGLLHKSLVQTIVEALEAKIINGGLKPGERLVEQAMCDMLGVSRAPLREAYRILENHSFLENRQRKGVYVSSLSRKEAVEIYYIRANLESLATYLAVKSSGPELAKELQAIHAVMKDAAERGDHECYIRNNLRFHEILVIASGSNRLVDMLRTFNRHTTRYRIQVLNTPGKFRESIERHAELIDAIARGDAEGAERMRKASILANIPLVEKTFEVSEVEPTELDGGTARDED